MKKKNMEATDSWKEKASRIGELIAEHNELVAAETYGYLKGVTECMAYLGLTTAEEG